LQGFPEIWNAFNSRHFDLLGQFIDTKGCMNFDGFDDILQPVSIDAIPGEDPYYIKRAIFNVDELKERVGHVQYILDLTTILLA
jgi:hypothetical protein